jgi:GGDEF domain-containing protein
MNKKTTNVAALLVSALFLISIVSFITGLISDYRNGPAYSEYVFKNFSAQIKKQAKEYQPESPSFTTAFEHSIAEYSSDILSVRLFRGKTLVYSWPKNARTAPGENKKTPFIMTRSEKLTGSNPPLMLSADLYILKPASIFLRARVAFLLILCGTVIAGLLLIHLYVASHNSESENQAAPDLSPDTAGTEKIDNVPDGPEDSNFKPEVPVTAEPEDLNFDSDGSDPDDSIDFNFPEITDLQTDNAETESGKTTDEMQKTGNSQQVSEEEQKTTEHDDAELFSPVTGLGMENLLTTRLESELIRSAASEQDLSVFVFHIPGLDYHADISKDLITILLRQFQFRDLIFEYKGDSFAALLQQADLDTAYTIAETIYNEMNTLIARKESNLSVKIGIASRSLRLISGERLLLEAAQAEKHADTENPIVAFRVDPEKYRKFIAGKSE